MTGLGKFALAARVSSRWYSPGTPRPGERAAPGKLTRYSSRLPARLAEPRREPPRNRRNTEDPGRVSDRGSQHINTAEDREPVARASCNAPMTQHRFHNPVFNPHLGGREYRLAAALTGDLDVC